AAEILAPEHTTSYEIGLKTRSFDQLSFDVSWFDMTFENLVVSILGSGGLPEFLNAGKERFRGVETSLKWTPRGLAGTSFSIGYAHHDARFVDFTFVDPDGNLVDASGNQLELVSRDLVSGRVDLRTPRGIGGFVAARNQGKRPVDPDNVVSIEGFTE